MDHINDELIERSINALDSFLALDEIIKHFRDVESKLTRATLACPTESDKRLFERCLNSARCVGVNAKLAMIDLENHGGLHPTSVNRLTESVVVFNRKYCRVIKRFHEIVDLLENNKDQDASKDQID